MWLESVILGGRIFQEEETAHVKAQGMRRVSGIRSCATCLEVASGVEDGKF